jgi:hypothetical protein
VTLVLAISLGVGEEQAVFASVPVVSRRSLFFVEDLATSWGFSTNLPLAPTHELSAWRLPLIFTALSASIVICFAVLVEEAAGAL